MRLVISALFSILSYSALSQCIVINEIMINGPGDNDGQNSPNTEEWIELFNTCDISVDISCWVVADGDFSVTIPTGTIIEGNGYYTIGSGNAGFTVDLNWATCNCANGSQIGVFTNGNEQLALVNDAGQIQDGLVWGSGQFPANNTTSSSVGCSSQSLSFANSGAGYEAFAGAGGSNGCTAARSCDGSETWTIMCNDQITPGSTNSTDAPEPDLSASSQEICPGECINFSDLTGSGVTSWAWTFDGAVITSSDLQNPQQICYNNLGQYSVTLEITTACGVSSTTFTDYITVQNNANPVISADGPLNICPGGSVELQSTSSATSYQWNLNGEPIDNADQNSYVATEAGTYTLSTSNGSCSGLSNELTVTIGSAIVPVINEGSVVIICENGSTTLSTQNTYTSYQWLFNGQAQSNSNSSVFNVSGEGNYQVIATDANGCEATSTITTVQAEPFDLPQITSSTGSFEICEGDEITLSIPGEYDSYIWTLNGEPLQQATGNTLVTGNDGEYAVIITSGSCTYTTNPVEIVIYFIPEVSINPNGTIETCSSTVLINGTSGGSFQWYYEGELIPDATNAQYTATQAGDYYFISQSQAGCEAISETVTVIFNENITVDIQVSDATPCPGEPVTLSIAGSFATITWSNNQTGPSIQITNGGNYSVTVTQGACTVTDEVDVTYASSPTAVLNPSNDIVTCEEVFTLSATSNGNIQWLFNDEPIIGSTSANLNVFENGTYSFIATSVNGCTTLSNEVEVTFTDGLEVSIDASSLEVCQGQSITLSVPNIYDAVVWSNSETGNSITVTSGDFYTVEVSQAGCIGSAFIELTFNPIPMADAGNDTIADCDLGVILMGTGSGILTWQPHPSLEEPENPFTLANPTVTTTYTLIATLGTCTATDQVTVEADCTSLFIPNVFTPNGDGKNDYFVIEGRGVKTFELKIFNRWGSIVYETNDLKKPWTGGQNEYYAPDGTYFWTVVALDQNNQPIVDKDQSSGHVTILR